MTERTRIPNAFEFVAVAGARARQLMDGCVPRVTGSNKPVRLAALEVEDGLVRRIENEETDAENRK
jgi:DNA-directed RNA polymerase subunit K/omega